MGLSPELKSAFSGIINTDKPVLKHKQNKPDLNWLAGFARKEGCFYLVVQNRLDIKTGFSVK